MSPSRPLYNFASGPGSEIGAARCLSDAGLNDRFGELRGRTADPAAAALRHGETAVTARSGGPPFASGSLPPASEAKGVSVGPESVVRAARGWIGTPYLHQASRRGAGADCLGLIRGLWRELSGVEPEAAPAYSADWSEASGDERLWSAASRHLRSVAVAGEGSVLLFRMRERAVAKHLGVVTRIGAEGPVAFVHAYAGQGVVECSLSSLWRRHLVAQFDFPWVSR